MSLNSDMLTKDVIGILEDILQQNDITEKSMQEDIPEWDSMAYMTIISVVESKYDIEITQDNIGGFYSVQSIVSLLSD